MRERSMVIRMGIDCLYLVSRVQRYTPQFVCNCLFTGNMNGQINYLLQKEKHSLAKIQKEKHEGASGLRANTIGSSEEVVET